MLQADITAELADRRRQLSKRENNAGLSKNVEALKDRIAELMAMTPDDAPTDNGEDTLNGGQSE